jgi:hypothetical protein
MSNVPGIALLGAGIFAKGGSYKPFLLNFGAQSTPARQFPIC